MGIFDSSFKKGRAVGRRGVVLLEVMLATAIAGLSLMGFAVALQKCLEASSLTHGDAMLRSALQSRMAEVRAEQLQNGKLLYYYYGNAVVVEQQIMPAGLKNGSGEVLAGMFHAIFVAKSVKSNVSPLEVESILYSP